MRLKVPSAKRRPFCLGLNVLRTILGGFIATMHEGTCTQEVLIPILYADPRMLVLSRSEYDAIIEDYIVNYYYCNIL